jgi:hypothetical protein
VHSLSRPLRTDVNQTRPGDGSTYRVARGVNIKRMKAGEKVIVTTSGFGGPVEASAIILAVD